MSRKVTAGAALSRETSQTKVSRLRALSSTVTTIRLSLPSDRGFVAVIVYRIVYVPRPSSETISLPAT